jgi:riboflavin biosynthesis pyrimidine reductase
MTRRVFPNSADTTIAQAYDAPLEAPSDRSWVGLCMVSSIDGSTVVDGQSTELSSANDLAVLLGLRRLADVIIVGAGTVRGEGYGPPDTPGQRVGVVTASGQVDTSLPLFTSGAGFLITTDDADVAADVDSIQAGTGRVDLQAAVARLGEIHPAPHFVQVEGGALLNGAVLDADLFDEINLTTSPLCVGGAGPRLTTGATDLAQRFELAQMVIDDQSFVFSRWKRKR